MNSVMFLRCKESSLNWRFMIRFGVFVKRIMLIYQKRIIIADMRKKLVEEMLDILELWEENSVAERFPIDQIDELEKEYEIIREHHWK